MIYMYLIVYVRMLIATMLLFVSSVYVTHIVLIINKYKMKGGDNSTIQVDVYISNKYMEVYVVAYIGHVQ